MNQTIPGRKQYRIQFSNNKNSKPKKKCVITVEKKRSLLFGYWGTPYQIMSILKSDTAENGDCHLLLPVMGRR